eukprot:jgi/Hompol1/4211/HPOL_003518-RA
MAKFLDDCTWIDRVSKELKGQRQWSQKWQALNDPRLYMGEDTPMHYPQKSKDDIQWKSLHHQFQ